ncbi:MAG: cyclic nucleotide-binding domain-containing protein [Alphaproteobacteria bacterium]|nr:cyclic nucleotide-binding domain-containing protein [Alphaproteobacteria bacterium]MCB9792762.1 cyclic nucleotide-binding domain-containing protein [Alphaproteobacteria bacterium]
MSNAPRLRLADAQPHDDSASWALLRGHPALAELREADLREALALGAQVREREAGARLLEAGTQDRALLFLLKGRAQVICEDGVLGERVAGELLGECSAFSQDGLRLASARGVTDCTLLVLGEDTLLRLRLRGNPVVEAAETLALRMLAKRAHLEQRRVDAAATERAGGLLSRLLGACRARAERPELQQALSQCPAFRGLSGRAWRAIAESSLLLELEAGQDIPADRAATVLLSGKVERVVAGERVSARPAQGELVGLGGLVHPVGDVAALRAREHSWVLCVAFARLRHRMQQDAALAQELRGLVAAQLVGDLAGEGLRLAA